MALKVTLVGPFCASSRAFESLNHSIIIFLFVDSLSELCLNNLLIVAVVAVVAMSVNDKRK